MSKSNPKSKIQNPKSQKLWGGGYAKATSRLVERFTESISFDKRLAPFDVRLSLAHAEMLGRQRIISLADAKKIVKGLKAIQKDIETGRFEWNEALEDVHMNIEAELTRRIGEAGKRVHTGRSRNDQVATAFRLYCADAAERIIAALSSLHAAFGIVREKFGAAIMPGYTHLQQAQPVTFAAWAMAYQMMLERDLVRFSYASGAAMNEMPLGAAALAGTTVPLDRNFTTKRLGFRKPAPSTMDAVSNRDFALDLLYASSVLAVHLSRLSEDLIIYSTSEFGFVKLDDAVTTGSSIMPQKKNPDTCELTRGKTGRVIGDLVSLLTTMKGLPLTYNRDMQEDKEPVFDATDTVHLATSVMAEAVRSMKFNPERARAAMDDAMLATDLAEEMVENGAPFREAHEVIAKLVNENPRLRELTAEELAAAHPTLRKARKRLDFDEAVRRRGLPR